MTKAINHIFFAILALAGLLSALPEGSIDIIPARWKPYVGGAVVAAAWIKGHRNLFVNPDGTPALAAWIGPAKDGK